MDDAKEGNGSLKKRHLGLVGLATVLLQYGVGVHNEQNTRDTIRLIAGQEMSKVQKQVSEIREERERYFVRKADLAHMLESMDAKLDRIEDRTGSMGLKISRIEGYLRSKSRGLFTGDYAGRETAGITKE